MSGPRERAKLSALIAKGHLPTSACGTAFRAWLRPLLDTGMVRFDRHGAGRRLVLVDAPAVKAFFDKQFPAPADDPAVGSRASGVAGFRNSKALRNDTPEIVHARVVGASPLITDADPALAAEATATHGVFSFLLPGRTARPKGHWVLIENPAVFLWHDRIFGPQASAVLVRGRISGRLLDWLAGHRDPELRITHAPDYDPTGLHDHLRLHRALTGNVRLFLPDDLDERFDRFSNTSLLKDDPRHQSQLRTLLSSAHPDIVRCAALMVRHNAGLEQEALLLSTA